MTKTISHSTVSACHDVPLFRYNLKILYYVGKIGEFLWIFKIVSWIMIGVISLWEYLWSCILLVGWLFSERLSKDRMTSIFLESMSSAPLKTLSCWIPTSVLKEFMTLTLVETFFDKSVRQDAMSRKKMLLKSPKGSIQNM